MVGSMNFIFWASGVWRFQILWKKYVQTMTSHLNVHLNT